MDFYTLLDQVIDLLRQRQRVTYRALKVQFHLDDEALEALKEELVYGQRLATDADGRVLVWTGDTGPTAPPPATPVQTPERMPLTYTPSYLAEKILTSRSALEGERKQVTVLFADLKGSTELIRDLDPEAAQRLLDPALQHMMDAVHRFEGTVNQVLGDGIMALFGAPVAHEDHAVRACYAALAMQTTMRRYAEEVRRSHGLEMQARVGLNSGEVVVRAISNGLHVDYSAVGQTTHLAARMEQLATPGSIRLTAATLRLAEGLVQVNTLGQFPVKGLTEPVEVFELVGASAIRRRLQASAARGLTRFVGRQQELTALQQAMERAGAGHGEVASLVGEAGVGKSRLIYEFVHAHHTSGWSVLESASVSYGKATPYFPVIDLLRRYGHIEDQDDTRTIRAKLTGQVLTLDEALQDTVPALLSLLDALPEDSRFARLDPPQRRQRTLDALKRVVLRESQVQPLLLVFEDLHWIDSETQALLNSLVESLPTAQILLLVTYRPEYQHGWGNKTYYTQLRLDPLPPVSADELLQALLGDDASLAPLKHLLIARTEGNPFFLEESVRTLVETGVLVREPGAYCLGQALQTIQVPATVQAVLAARIDRLPPEEKRLLQTAAVIGHEVPLPLLQAIADLPEEVLHRSLAHVQVTEFLYETQLFPECEYTFKHALTYEVAYGSLLLERRRALHAQVVFQKWRWTEIAVTLGLVFVASIGKEWPMTFIAVRCPHCQSDQIVKRGKTARGTQRYLCQNTLCAKGSFLLDYCNRGCLPEVKQTIIDMSLNASGVRDTARSLRICPNTVLRELKKKAIALESVNTSLLSTLNPDEVAWDMERAGEAEMDEMWSFVGHKGNPRWLWHAIDHHTGKVLAYVFGRRQDTVFLKLKALLEPFGITRYYTDYWGAYTRHLDPEEHTPGKQNTQKIERKHLTLRTRIKRLVRKTICFSKTTQMHDIVIGLFVNRYAFGRAV